VKTAGLGIVEGEFRAGQFSIREIARMQGLSDATIHKIANKNKLIMNLADRAPERFEADVVSDLVSTTYARTGDIISQAAALGWKWFGGPSPGLESL